MLHLTSIQVPSFGSHSHACHLLPPPKSHSTFIRVPRFTSIQVTSHLPPGPHIRDSPPSWSCLTSIQVSRFMSGLHRRHVSPPSSLVDSCRIPIHVIPRLHLGDESLFLTASKCHLTPIHSSTYPSHLNPCCVSHVVFHLPPGSFIRMSSPYSSHVISIQVPRFMLHSHPDRISKPIQVSRCAFHLNQSPDIRISSPCRSQHMHLTSFQVPIVASHLHPSRISPPFRSLDPYLTSIQVPSHLHPGLEMHPGPAIHISPSYKSEDMVRISSRSHLTCGWGLGSFKVVVTTIRNVWIIPSFRIWSYVLHVYHISCAITNCGQCQGVVPSRPPTARKVFHPLSAGVSLQICLPNFVEKKSKFWNPF